MSAQVSRGYLPAWIYRPLARVVLRLTVWLALGYHLLRGVSLDQAREELAQELERQLRKLRREVARAQVAEALERIKHKVGELWAPTPLPRGSPRTSMASQTWSAAASTKQPFFATP